MNYNKKIPGFTLSEILVVLVITAIVIGIAFSVLRLVTKQYNAINASYTYRTEVQQLKQRLLVDVNQSKAMRLNTEEDQLEITGADEMIIYTWNQDQLIRNTDTLTIGITEATFMRNGITVENGAFDGLKLHLNHKGRELALFVAKETDAKSYIQPEWD